jgi:hypothetical protein
VEASPHSNTGIVQLRVPTSDGLQDVVVNFAEMKSQTQQVRP